MKTIELDSILLWSLKVIFVTATALQLVLPTELVGHVAQLLDAVCLLEAMNRGGYLGEFNPDKALVPWSALRVQLIFVRLFNSGWSCNRTLSNELCTFNKAPL